MARVNATVTGPKLKTHEGAEAAHITPLKELQRSVLACMLYEDSAYESGSSIAKRIDELVEKVNPEAVAELAIQARGPYNLRHVPLLLCASLAHRGKLRADTLTECIQRADEMAEFLAIYWQEKRQPLSWQVKKGLRAAFDKFDAYQIARYQGHDRAVKLRDAMRIVHPKPSEALTSTFEAAVKRTLSAPDTWEAALSGGAGKKDTFERLMREHRLGYMALLRNLRTMYSEHVDKALVESELMRGAGRNRVLPFRFITAANHCPGWEDLIDAAMIASLDGAPKLKGKTVMVIDRSGSMAHRISGKSEMTRYDAANALAILAASVCEEVVIYATAGSDSMRKHATALMPTRKGMALADAIKTHDFGNLPGRRENLNNGGIFLTQTMNYIAEREEPGLIGGGTPIERVIVFTDEQDTDIGSERSPAKAKRPGRFNYLANVSVDKPSINFGPWTQINGFSEAILDFIRLSEEAELQ